MKKLYAVSVVMVSAVANAIRAQKERLAVATFVAYMSFYSQYASAQQTITDPVGMGDYVTGLITALGTVLGAVVGGYFAILLVKKGLRWAGRIG